MVRTKFGILGEPIPTLSFQNWSSGSTVRDESHPKVVWLIVNAEAGAGVPCINEEGGGVAPLIISAGGIIKLIALFDRCPFVE
jgi:hypothetical protein